MTNIKNVAVKPFGSLPEKALFIGEGNFIRAFAGSVVEKANDMGKFNGSIVIAPPRSYFNCSKLYAQNCRYTVLSRGLKDGKEVVESQIISSVSRCVDPCNDWQELVDLACSVDLQVIVSNTTEAGIAYRKGETLDNVSNSVYPARLAALLYARFEALGESAPKLLILPCELIENNGDALRECVMQYAHDWSFGGTFRSFLFDRCFFANTLVDRIVTGFPKDEYTEIAQELGYDDELLAACEPFLFWAIECPEQYISCFPVNDIGLDIVFASDISKYRTRKVRILNGAHTSSVLAAYLCGHDTVGEMMADPLFDKLLHTLVYKEIIPATDMATTELVPFADAVFDRFSNPFIKHRLLDISLNSVSKYRARCKDTLLDSIAKGTKHDVLTFALAALIYFYIGGGREHQVKDSAEVCDYIGSVRNNKNAVSLVLSNTDFWGCSLECVKDAVEHYINDIEISGMRNAIEHLLKTEEHI